MFAWIPRLFNRPEPELDRQPLCLEHLRDMGRAVPKHLLSNAAYGAFLTIAASRVRIADAYTHAGGEWVLELHGAYPWQECRFSPEQWNAFYEVFLTVAYQSGNLDGAAWLRVCRYLANEHPNGALASVVDNVVAANRRVRAAGSLRRLFGANGGEGA